MDKYIFDKSNGLWYELQGDYYIPCLILAEEETQPIGLWGQRHKQYLKEHRHIVYTTMLIDGTLNRYLAEWEQAVKNGRKPAEKQHRPPERQSVRNRLRQLQEEGKQNAQPKQRKKSQDRDR